MEVKLNQMAIRSNFKLLRLTLEQKIGRRVTYDEIVAEVNRMARNKGEEISKPTLVRFANDNTGSVNYTLLEGLYLFFKQHGLECEPGDFITYVPNHNDSTSAVAA